MPTNSLFGNIEEDQRALQLALELSFLGLSSGAPGHCNNNVNHNNSSSPSSSSSPTDSGGLLSNSDVSSFFNQAQFNSTSGGGSCGPTSSLLTSNLNSDSDDDLLQYPQCILGGGPLFSSPSAHLMTPEDLRAFILPKKSQNMTECVPVPSSEHVAEIVGRQGKKPCLSFIYK